LKEEQTHHVERADEVDANDLLERRKRKRAILPRIFIGVPTPAQLTRMRGAPSSDAIVATVVSPVTASAMSIANARPPVRSMAVAPIRRR